MSLDQLTLFQAASHANLSANQGNSWERQTPATSGRRLAALLPQHSRLGLLSKMLLTSFLWSSTLYKLTWKVKVTKSGRRYFQLAPSMRRTSAKERQSWPTPCASNPNENEDLAQWEARRAAVEATKKNGNGFGTPLAIAVKKAWATPTARESMPESMAAGMKRKSPSLTTLAKMWQTPLTSDANGIRKPDGKRGVGLNTQVMWSTPTAHDGKNCMLPPAAEQRQDIPGDLMRSGYSGYLNPAFVEMLMGVPVGWTELPDGPPIRAKTSSTTSRRGRSRSASKTTHDASTPSATA